MSEKALVRSKQLWLAQNKGQFQSLLGQVIKNAFISYLLILLHQFFIFTFLFFLFVLFFPLNQRFVGVSSACSLVSTVPKRGQHKCHVSVSTDIGIKTYNVILSKEMKRSRDGEDDLVSRLMLKAILDSKYITNRLHDENNDVFDEMNQLDMKNGDEIIEKIMLRNEAIDNFLLDQSSILDLTNKDKDKGMSSHELKSNPNVVRYKKDMIKQASIDSLKPELNQTSSSLVREENVLFIPYSMSETPDQVNAQEGMLAFPNFKPQQRTIVYPGSFNPLHKVSSP